MRFADEYGHYQNVDGVEYYLLDDPYRAFELGNAPFAKDPFYAQFLVRVEGEKARRWYFSFSFMAHMGMGNTAFGNGPEANDIGVISESQAFPNTWINGFGRVDGDRAFVGKVFFGYYLSPRLFLSSSIKYRDGDPFAFINAFKRDGQWVITYQTIKAEDEHAQERRAQGGLHLGLQFQARLRHDVLRQERPAWSSPSSTCWISAASCRKTSFPTKASAWPTSCSCRAACAWGSFWNYSRGTRPLGDQRPLFSIFSWQGTQKRAKGRTSSRLGDISSPQCRHLP